PGFAGAVKVAVSPVPRSLVWNAFADTSCWTLSSCLTVTVAPGATVSGAPYPKSLMVMTVPFPAGDVPAWVGLRPPAGGRPAAVRARAAPRSRALIPMVTDRRPGWFRLNHHRGRRV